MLLRALLLATARLVTIALLGTATAAAEQLTGADSVGIARRLESEGHPDRAERLLLRLLATADTPDSVDSLRAAEAHLVLASLLQSGSRYDSAREHANRALVLYAARLGMESPQAIDARRARASALVYSDRLLEGKAEADRALEVERRVRGPDSPRALRLLNLRAIARNALGERDSAGMDYREALAIAERLVPPDSALLLAVLGNYARFVHYQENDLDRARGMYERALAISETKFGRENSRAAFTLISLGELLHRQGSKEEAGPYLARAVRILEGGIGRSQEQLGWALAALGVLKMETGDYRESESLLRRSLEVRERALGPEHSDLALNLLHLAALYATLADDESARPLLERAAALRERAMPQSLDYAETIRRLGSLYARSGDLAKARDLMERALLIAEEVEGPESAWTHFCLFDLCQLLRRAGKSAEAFPYVDRMERVARAHGDSTPEDRYEMRVTRAQLLRDVGRPREAIPLLEQHLAQYDSSGALSAWYGQVLWELALARHADGDLNGAIESALGAESQSRAHVRATVPHLAEDQALAVARDRTRNLDLAVSAILERAGGSNASGDAVRRCFDELIRSRGLILDVVAARRRGLGPVPDSIAREYRLARRELAGLLVSSFGRKQPPDLAARLERARHRSRQAEMSLAEYSANSGAGERGPDVGLSGVATALDRGCTMVSYLVYQRHLRTTKSGWEAYLGELRYAAFVSSGDSSAPVLVGLGPADSIDGLVERWRALVSREADGAGDDFSESEYRLASTALRRAIWDPIVSNARTLDSVILVPDGQLQLVDWATFAADGSKYLAEKGPTFHYLSTERDLLGAHSDGAEGGMLAVGDPDFDALETPPREPGTASAVLATAAGAPPFRGPLPACEGLDALQWAALPGTRAEIQEVSAIWRDTAARKGGRGPSGDPAAISYTGSSAREEVVKHAAPGRRVLHLATHGFFLDESCRGDGATSRGIGGISARRVHEAGRSAWRENPLRLSGLVFAGANRRTSAPTAEDDGILTSEEIAALDLSSVRLAVLSACETGVGSIHRGEGVFGLRRAFESAGAHALVMSLWSVDDQQARAWMRQFYEHRFRRRLSLADAARAASVSMLRERRARGMSTHPFHWAGFIASGR